MLTHSICKGILHNKNKPYFNNFMGTGSLFQIKIASFLVTNVAALVRSITREYLVTELLNNKSLYGTKILL